MRCNPKTGSQCLKPNPSLSLNPPYPFFSSSATKVKDFSTLTNHAVEEYPTDNGPADYALFVEGKLLGILEAKKVSVDPQNVLEQAKRYARGVNTDFGNWGEYGVPFLYSSILCDLSYDK